MPRVKKTKKLPVAWKKMNQLARLEEQLAHVVEPGPVSNPAPKIHSRFLNLHRQAEVRVRTVRASVEVNAIKLLDQQLVAEVAKRRPGRIKGIQVRIGEHVPSQNIVEIRGLAKKIHAKPERGVELVGIEEWTAPYEEPPAIEDLAAVTGDLRLPRIDPHEFVSQFTAGDHDVAYHESYRWWNKLRAPFIVWELRARKTERQVVAVVKTEIKAVEQAVESVEEKIEETIAEAEQEWNVPVVLPRLSFARVMAGFFGLAFIVSVPAGAVSLSRQLSSSWSEVQAKGAAAVDAAVGLRFKEASAGLAETDRALNRVNVLAVAAAQALPETRDTYATARSLIAAGEQATEAASLLEQGLEKAMTSEVRYPVERIHLFDAYAESALPALERASDAMGRVQIDKLPESVRTQAEEAKNLISDVRSAVRELRAVNAFLVSALGEERQRRYLLVFQNPSELRPTGGFMGSLAEFTLDRGEIRKIHFPGGGPYDLQGELKVRVAAPGPLQLVSARWEFQDANWFPDFPAAAEKINWFWNKAGQSTVDGIVAVNARVVIRLLELTGPVELPEYGKTITAENFMLETQKAVELEYDKEENKPKQFVGDLMHILLERLKNPSRDQQLALLSLAAESLVTKDVQVWLADDEEESLAERFGWNGRFLPATGDTLAVIGANIAGQKSDAAIEERVTKDVQIAADGSMVNTVRIERTHTGEKGALFQGVNNVTYLRVYVPEGSELLEASGFNPPPESLFEKPLPQDLPDADLAAQEKRPRLGPANVRITDEFGRTAFGGWVQLNPGETSVTTFVYRLPFSAYDLGEKLSSGASSVRRPAYLSSLVSQSGKPERAIEVRVHVPEAWKTSWTNLGSLGIKDIWDRDRVVAALFENK